MNRCRRTVLALAGTALLAVLALAACTDRNAPDRAYLDQLHAWSAPRLLQERNALTAEETALDARLAETRTGDLPPDARTAALRSLENSRAEVQAKRKAVDQALASGQYARSELRYPVKSVTLPAPGESPTPEAQAQAPAARPATTEAQAAPAGPAKTSAATLAVEAVPARVLGVEIARTDAGLTVRLKVQGRPHARLFTMDAPPRIVLDLSGVAEPAFRLSPRPLGAAEAHALRLGWHPEGGFLRLVLDTDPAHLGRATLDQAPDALLLRIAP